MTFEEFMLVVLIGFLAGNAMVAGGTGVDLAGNNLRDIKNSLILSLIIFAVTLVSAVFIFVINLILESIGLGSAVLIITVLVVAIMVQIAEFVVEKICPILHALLGGFFVTMIPTISVILLGVYFAEIGFGIMILEILVLSLGIACALAVVSGVRNIKLTHSTYDVFKGNLMTVTILFVLTLVWSVL